SSRLFRRNLRSSGRAASPSALISWLASVKPPWTGPEPPDGPRQRLRGDAGEDPGRPARRCHWRHRRRWPVWHPAGGSCSPRRCTVDHLDTSHAGTLDPSDGLIVRSHLDYCPPCRMRRGELANAPAALAAAVPAAPLLGGEAQHHWLALADDVRPADHLLPPG